MANNSYAVTPSDAEDLEFPTTSHRYWGRSLYIGVPGDVALWLVDEPRAPVHTRPTVFKDCPVGWLNVPAFRRVLATGTTAGELLVREQPTPDANEVAPSPGGAHVYVREVLTRRWCPECKRPFPL